MRTSLIVLMLYALPAAARSAGDVYLEYVNAMIPMTKEVADRDAKLREYGLFANRASTLQRHLVQGAEDGALAAAYVDRLGALETLCPEAGGKVDVAGTLAQVLVAAQAANFGERLKGDLESYKALARDTEAACDDKKSFEAYRIANLDFVFYYPEKLDPLAGASVKFSFGGEAFEGSTTTGIPIVSAVFNFFDRSANNEKFQAGKAKLLAEHANDAFYQAAAMRHCKAALKDSRDTLDAYAAAATSMRRLSDALPLPALRAREAVLRRCLEKDRETFVAYVQSEARERARRPERLAAWEKAEALGLSSLAKKNVTTHVALLKEKPCDRGDALAFAAEEELALVDIAVPDASDYLQRARAGLKTIVDDRLAACGGRR